jgi:hypothetical protein
MRVGPTVRLNSSSYRKLPYRYVISTGDIVFVFGVALDACRLQYRSLPVRYGRPLQQRAAGIVP